MKILNEMSWSMIWCTRYLKSLINLSKDNGTSTKIRKSTDVVNAQCKSLKSIVKGHGPWTYIYLNPCKVNLTDY
jgi:hypothetical protein